MSKHCSHGDLTYNMQDVLSPACLHDRSSNICSLFIATFKQAITEDKSSISLHRFLLLAESRSFWIIYKHPNGQHTYEKVRWGKRIFFIS